MSKLDSNAWYAMSETRVDKTNVNVNSSLQVRDIGMRVYPIDDPLLTWQLQPVDAAKWPGRYVLRTFRTGPAQQLTACYVAEEQDPSRTRTCMQASRSDESQQWDISDWGDGTYKIQSVANGSLYWLDVYVNSFPHLSSVEEKPDNPRVAQHWVFSSRSAVNNEKYSTIFSQAVISTADPTLTRTTPTGNAAGTTSTSSPSSGAEGSSSSENSGGLSAGASAGIGVGVALAVLFLALFGFLWWRRYRASAAAAAGGGGGGPADASMAEKMALSSHLASLHVASPTGGSVAGYSEAAAGNAWGGSQDQNKYPVSHLSPASTAAYPHHDHYQPPYENSPGAVSTALHEAPAFNTVVAEMDGTGQNRR